jgi:ABC-type transport system involved in multi-copper enzyme maturation permease subunit
MPKMKNSIKIALYTIYDRMRPKSFSFFLILSVGLLVLTRGCYSSNYMFNGQHVEGTFYAARIIFQAVFMATAFLTVLLSMRIYKKDQGNGSIQMFFSRPVERWEYITGRLLGTWVTVSFFMLILHFALFLIIGIHTDNFYFGLIGSSLICSANLLFIVVIVFLFSLIMPGVISAMSAMALLCVGYLSDGGYKLLSLEALHGFNSQVADTGISAWRIAYPKLFMVQIYADSIIANSKFIGMGPVHPLVNTVFYIMGLVIITIFVFNRKEI